MFLVDERERQVSSYGRFFPLLPTQDVRTAALWSSLFLGASVAVGMVFPLFIIGASANLFHPAPPPTFSVFPK